MCAHTHALVYALDAYKFSEFCNKSDRLRICCYINRMSYSNTGSKLIKRERECEEL